MAATNMCSNFGSKWSSPPLKQGAYSISHKENGHSTQSCHNSDGEHWRDGKKGVQFSRTKCPSKFGWMLNYDSVDVIMN